MQSLDDKREAIKSLLPFIYYHLDFVPGALHVQRYGESEGNEGPPPRAYFIDCNGRCQTCLAWHRSVGKKPACPPEERWVIEYGTLRRKYRIRDIETAILGLADFDRIIAQAVWMTWVEPWPEWTPRYDEAAPLAEQGLEWLAHEIEGDVLGMGEMEPPRRTRISISERDRQIVQMRVDGASYGEIVRKLGCSKTTVRAVLADKRVSRGRTISAVGT
jgi:hypothetical protein